MMEQEEPISVSGNAHTFAQIKELLQKKKDLALIPSRALNRRYKKLQQLIEEDEFFSEEAIKMREPLLFYLYCGQFAKSSAEKHDGLSFAGFLENVAMNEEYREILEKEYAQSKAELPQVQQVSWG